MATGRIMIAIGQENENGPAEVARGMINDIRDHDSTLLMRNNATIQ
jgi:hypothetical protein